MVILFILSLFFVVVVGGNVNKCEVYFQGATKKVNLEQRPLNDRCIIIAGEYMNGCLLQ